jgi:hypothetical protein
LIAALVVAVFLLNRLIGMLAVIWAVCIVLLPRVYLGLHYPSDIVAGAALGAVIMVTAQRLAAPQELAPVLMRLEDEHRGLAQGVFFAFSYLCATTFSDLRELVQLFGEFLAISLVCALSMLWLRLLHFGGWGESVVRQVEVSVRTRP